MSFQSAEDAREEALLAALHDDAASLVGVWVRWPEKATTTGFPVVWTFKLGATWHPCDDAAGHEHAPSRPEVALVPRAHRQLGLHGTHHVHDTDAPAHFGRSIGTGFIDNA